MAFPHSMGLLPSEVAFLCEMSLVTIIPRQRLERLDLLRGPTTPLIPPQRTSLPLWLALLLKRQRRANIIPPPWLSVPSLQYILELETVHIKDSFSPSLMPKALDSRARGRDFEGARFWVSEPFLRGGGKGAVDSRGGRGGVLGEEDEASELELEMETTLPYHWFEMAELLLNDAADDIGEADRVRQLLRDIREVRLSKMRKGVDALSGDGEGMRLDGVGAMELSESRGFVLGVVDGLRKVGGSKEQARREREEEERANRGYGAGGVEDGDEDEDML